MSDGGQRSIDSEIDIPDGRESYSFRGCPRFGGGLCHFSPSFSSYRSGQRASGEVPSFPAIASSTRRDLQRPSDAVTTVVGVIANSRAIFEKDDPEARNRSRISLC